MSYPDLDPAVRIFKCPIVGCPFPGAPKPHARMKHVTDGHRLDAAKRAELGLPEDDRTPEFSYGDLVSLADWPVTASAQTLEKWNSPLFTGREPGPKGRGSHAKRLRRLEAAERPLEGPQSDERVLMCPLPLCGHPSPTPQGLGTHMALSHGHLSQAARKKLVRQVLAEAANPEPQPESRPQEQATRSAELTLFGEEIEAKATLVRTVMNAAQQAYAPEPNGVHGRPAIAKEAVRTIFPAGVPVEMLDDAYAFMNHAEHIARLSGQS